VTPQSGNQVLTSLGNSGLCWTVFARNRDTAVPAEGNGDLQTLICHCGETQTMSPEKNWMAAYIGYTLRMKMADQLWFMTRIQEENVEQSLLLLVTQNTDLSLHASKCCSVAVGVTLRVLETSCHKHFVIISRHQQTPRLITSVVTNWGTVVWRHRVDNTWPYAALTACQI